MLENHDIFARVGFARLDTHRFEVEAIDGSLDIELFARIENPRINAIEVERLR